MRLTLIAAACGAAFVTPSLAETTSDWLLDDIVVTATRTPAPFHALTSDVTVLRAEDIRAFGASTLPELLQGQSGLEVVSMGGLGSQSSLFLRGTNSNHVVVLVDGQRLYSATVGTTAIEHIPLAQIERIEILRGPASSLYGADAIGGVVQIFTRAGLGKSGVQLEAGAGSFGTYRSAASLVQNLGDTRLGLTLGSLDSSGFDATQTGTWGHNPDDDGYRNRSASLQLEHALGGGHALGLQGFFSSGRSEFDGGTNNDVQKQRLATYSVYSRHRFVPAWESTLRLGETVDRLHNLAWSSQIETRQRLYQWHNTVKLAAGNLLLAAERTEQEVDGTTNYTVKQRDNTAYQAGYQIEVATHALQASARRDDNSQFGGHSTGSLAYGYRFAPNWRLTASAGTAFKAPTFNDLYWPLSWGFAGNPNLAPERAVNRELGLRWQDGPSAFSAVYFHNRVKDLIAISDDWTTMVNVKRARIEGLALQGQMQIADWRLKASLDLQAPEDADTGKLLARRAKRHGSVEAARQLGPWDLRVQVLASDYRYDDASNTKKLGGYALTHVGLDYRASKELVLNARVNNLFDKRYALAGGYNTPERHFFIGLTYEPR